MNEPVNEYNLRQTEPLIPFSIPSRGSEILHPFMFIACSMHYALSHWRGSKGKIISSKIYFHL